MNSKIINIMVAASVFVLVCCVTGCSKDDPLTEMGPTSLDRDGLLASQVTDQGLSAPAGIVTVSWEGEDFELWPYTGANFSGSPKDPVNLIFAGHVKPMQIRAALLSLDGDRTGLGFPGCDQFPFNATWTDCIGNVQTGYAESDGWIGGVIQLELGAFGPVRFHLRLFETGTPYGVDGAWTVGAVHFEIQIPATTDHQVLSWELAEYVVVYDLMRSGLLDASSLPMPGKTDVITEVPSYRDIPEAVYNGVPEGLKALCLLPPGPAEGPVPIPNDGQATILCVAGTVPVVSEEKVQEFVVEYNQVVPMPFCNKGPLDYIHVSGPVQFQKRVVVSPKGRYQYSSTASGHLVAVPVDVLQSPPVPAGEPFKAIISDEQRGIYDCDFARVTFQSKRIAPNRRGAEKLTTNLHVSTNGGNIYNEKTQCLGPGE